MAVIVKLVQYIYSIYAMCVFLIFMFLLFPFVVLASFFGPIKAGNLVYSICRLWADLTLFFWGMSHKNIYEAPKITNEPVVFVFNHISYLDIPIIMKTLRHQPVRILGKAEMARIPIFGFIYRNAVIKVDRSSAEARAKSLAGLKLMLKKNISVVVAPEGTFNMTHKPLKDFYNGAFNVAIEMQTPIQPILFLDTYDRLNYKSVFSFTPGRSRSVFLKPIRVNDYSLQNMEVLKQKVYEEMESALIKYNASWIKHV
ncbi:MAG: 1-acyl-sn-glycerol-3-phosphate acyltransferase [Niastella sp.]|nr:1-acyl-sn-glycerol-3-phosphate acyltransferase [Niastella sp.]